MAANAIQNPFPVMTDTDGTALNNGFVYIGTVDLNPELNAVTVYWDKDLSIAAAQPVRTINGYFARDGSPGKLYIDAADYSIVVRNKNEALVHTSLANTDVLATVPSTSVTGQFNSDRIDFTQDGTGAVLRTVEDKLKDYISVADFGTTGDGVADDTVEIQAALDSISSGVVYFPAGTYAITAPLLIRTTQMTIRGDGVGATTIKCIAGFSGDQAVDTQDPTNCTVEDFTIDGDDLVADGLNIVDGTSIVINRVLVKNLTANGFHASNVNNLVFTLCGSAETGDAAFNFIASAALDGANTIVGTKVVMNDCYSTTADKDATGSGSIFTTQSDSSIVDLTVNRYKEISNSSVVSVGAGGVHASHFVKLNDCTFVDNVLGVAVTNRASNVVRTAPISVAGANTSIIDLGSAVSTASNQWGGLVHILASDSEFTANSSVTAAYLYLITNTTTDPIELIQANGKTTGAAANEPSFDFSLSGTDLRASPVGSTSGTFYFYITMLGNLSLTD